MTVNPEPTQWGATCSQPLGAPAAPAAPVYVADFDAGTLTPPPRRRRTGLVVGLALAALVLAGGTAAGTYLLTRPTSPGPAAAAANAPVLSNIARPNPACTPAADRKLGPGDDLSSILFVGYIDGQQKEMVVGQVLSLALAGHKVDYVWYCPLRSQWRT